MLIRAVLFFIVLEMTNRTAEVYPYDSSYDPIENVPIVSGATAYDDKTNGSTYILVFFYGKKLEHSLINPNQVRDHGLEFWDDPFDKRQELAIIIDDDLRIPLSYNGTRLSFKSRVPTRDELTNCQHIDMTSTSPWEPSQVRLGQVVGCTRRHIFSIKVDENYSSTAPSDYSTSTVRIYEDPSSDEAILSEVNTALISFKESSIRCINATYAFGEDIPARKTFVSNERHRKVTLDSLAELWHIGPSQGR